MKVRKNIYLNMSGKSLTNEDAPKVLEKLASDRRINQLDLSNNLIGDQGIKEIVRSSLMNNVFYFNLYNNHIGDEGAVAVIVSSKNNNIASLNLGKNNITKTGLISMAENLPGSKIVNLDLILNPGSADLEAFEAIFKAAKQHTLLQYLHVPTDYNRRIRPILLENRDSVSQIINLVTELQDCEEFEYPMISLNSQVLAKFQEIYYNQMMNSPLMLQNNTTTCLRILNYINDHFFKITGVVQNNLELEDCDSVSIASLPPELLSEITKYCTIADVKTELN